MLYLDKTGWQRSVLHEVHGCLAEERGGVDGVGAAGISKLVSD